MVNAHTGQRIILTDDTEEPLAMPFSVFIVFVLFAIDPSEAV
jgi:hypothetical protein